jgi:hypothetical protein
MAHAVREAAPAPSTVPSVESLAGDRRWDPRLGSCDVGLRVIGEQVGEGRRAIAPGWDALAAHAFAARGSAAQGWLRRRSLRPSSWSSGVAEATEAAIYLTMSLRNAGSGIAVLHGCESRWLGRSHCSLSPIAPRSARSDTSRATCTSLRATSRSGKGAYRDPGEAEFSEVASRVRSRERLFVDLLYGDHRGGQRVVSRFSLQPRASAEDWYVTVSRHWNVDLPDPR